MRRPASSSLQGVRVCVLVRCAHGLPDGCGPCYVKVACAGATKKTPACAAIAGAAGPSWHALLAFDVADAERAALTFRCKRRRRFVGAANGAPVLLLLLLLHARARGQNFCVHGRVAARRCIGGHKGRAHASSRR